ncbi:MAG: alpha/beta fold hydrolase [Rubricoccaceae bacterium]|nr:alpha/beta fold hydrolase [Rubricoccaceae bacterium]
MTAPSRDGALAVLNGVLGDRLAAQNSPLAMPMQLRHAGRPLVLDAASLARSVPAPSDTLLVLVHGLCMHDGQWGDEAHDPGATLARRLGATSVTLRYNSGRHISENGRDFASALDALVAAWPRAVRRLVVVGHSMGGLVARSACHYAAEAGYAWPTLDASLVTLGTPHHGAPLERLGNGIDTLLEASRYAAPFARLGYLRSAGVTDLRYGHLLDGDWTGRPRFARGPDTRTPLPLPEGVACYLVAATTGARRRRLRDQTLGDGLVPLDSALGLHPDPARALDVPAEQRWVARGMNHFDLLRRPEVTEQLRTWLAPGPMPSTTDV